MSGPADQPGAGPRATAARLRAARVAADPLSEPSRREVAFAKGGEGETRLGARLNADCCRWGGFGVLHSLSLAGTGGDIDHVVVGPTGVTVIDCKAWEGVVTLRGGSFRLGGWSKQRELEGVHRQAERVRAALGRAGLSEVDVHGVLCLVNANAGTSAWTVDWVDGVGIGAPGPVVRYASRAGRALSVERMQKVHAALAAGFRIGGGALAPAPALARPVLQAPLGVLAAHRRPRRRRLVANLASIALVALMIPLTVSAIEEQLGPMTRSQLAQRMPALRRQAAVLAAGAVRGPRVSSTPRRFTLVFRRGRRCRVVARVARRGDARPVMRSAGCHR